MSIDQLRTITLDELIDRADLLTRVDRKYLLPAESLPAVLRGLPADARVLEIDGRRCFTYRSAYFDTPGLDSYLATAHRRRRRFKVRIRSYLDSCDDFLEVKTRGSRGTTVKQRFPYAGKWSSLGPDAQHLAVAALSSTGIAVPATFTHVLTTRYERTTFFLPSTGGRITVDRALAGTLPHGTTLRTPDRVIVETKSSRSALPVDRRLWSLAHRPCAVSKYATGLAALRPDLPANRWQPVLRRHFQKESRP